MFISCSRKSKTIGNVKSSNVNTTWQFITLYNYGKKINRAYFVWKKILFIFVIYATSTKIDRGNSKKLCLDMYIEFLSLVYSIHTAISILPVFILVVCVFIWVINVFVSHFYSLKNIQNVQPFWFAPNTEFKYFIGNSDWFTIVTWLFIFHPRSRSKLKERNIFKAYTRKYNTCNIDIK